MDSFIYYHIESDKHCNANYIHFHNTIVVFFCFFVFLSIYVLLLEWISCLNREKQLRDLYISLRWSFFLVEGIDLFQSICKNNQCDLTFVFKQSRIK